MGTISPLHLLIVAVIALIVIGPGKLPETGAALGKALREFREAQRDDLLPTPGPTPAAGVGPGPAPALPPDPAPTGAPIVPSDAAAPDQPA